MGGPAVATSRSTSSGDVNSYATATGGNSPLFNGSGTALAIAYGNGTNGSASTSSSTPGGTVVSSVNGQTSANVQGSVQAQSFTAIGQTARDRWLVSGSQSSAYLTGSPTAADSILSLAGAPHVHTSFDVIGEGTGPASNVLALGVLGGASAPGASGGSTINTSYVTFTITPSQLSNPQSLVLGLLNPQQLGNGFDSLVFTLTDSGTSLVNQTFNSASAALTYFTDNTVSLGSTTTLAGSYRATFSITTHRPGDGFNASFILGNTTTGSGPAFNQWNASGSGSFNSAANWSAGTVPGAGQQANFLTVPTSDSVISLSGNVTLAGITFNNTHHYTIGAPGGNSITLNGGTVPAVIDLVNGTHTIAAPQVLASAAQVETAPGTQLTILGGITGSGALTTSGIGLVSLSSTGAYTGGTTVNAGTLEVTAAGSVTGNSVSVATNGTLTVDTGGSLSAGTNLSDNGTVNFNNPAVTLATLNGTGLLNLNSTALTVTNGGMFNGAIADGASTGSVYASGGTLTLGGSNTYTGPTTVTGGTTTLSGSLASTSISVSAGATLNVTSTGALATGTNLVDNGTTALSNASDTLATLNGSGVLGLSGTAITLTNGGTFSGTVSDGATAGSLALTGGTLNLTNPNTFTGQTTVTVTASTLNLGPNTGSGFDVRNIHGLSINAGGKVNVLNSTSHANRTLLSVGTLSFSGTGLLNLGSNDLDVANGSLSTITSEIATGGNFAAGANFNGTSGITSSSAAGDSTHLTSLGVIQNNQSGTPLFTATNKFDGTVPGPADVLVKYTYYGDANLDGKVDGSDYSRIDAAYVADQAHPGTLTGWFNGDFDYDGIIDGSDYALIDNAFNSQGASLAAVTAGEQATIAQGTNGSGAVPEPASLALLGVCAPVLLGRRRLGNTLSS